MASELHRCEGERWMPPNVMAPCTERAAYKVGGKWFCDYCQGPAYHRHQNAIAAAKERVVAAAKTLRGFYGNVWGETKVGLSQAPDMEAAWLEFYAAVDALEALEKED